MPFVRSTSSTTPRGRATVTGGSASSAAAPRDGPGTGHLKRKFGITLADYDRILEEQGGRCAICGDDPGDVTLHVDHDHDTGEIRALLCIRCNNGIGLFRESPELFDAAATYVGVTRDPEPEDDLAPLVAARVGELECSRG